MTDGRPTDPDPVRPERRADARRVDGHEARAVAAHFVVEHRKARELERALASILVALVHREARRGLVGADGRPVLPMTLDVPAEDARVGLSPRWELAITPTAGGVLRLAVAERVEAGRANLVVDVAPEDVAGKAAP